MAITQTQALQAVIDAARTTSSLAILQAKVSTVRPAVDYITVLLVTDEPIGFPQTSEGDGDLDVRSVREARFQVSGYGETAPFLQALAILAFVPQSSVGKALRTAQVHPQRTVGPRNNSNPYRTDQEPRATLDLVCQYVLDPTATLAVAAATSIVVDLHARGDQTLNVDNAILIPEP